MNTRSIAQTPDDQPTVVCLHSSGSTGGQWAALRAQLEPAFRVVTPDFHGHGTGPAWHGNDEDIVAADAARIARIAESVPGGVHLVGHSYGAAVALRVALHHPASVRDVAVYEPVAFRILFEQYGRRRPASEVTEVAREVRRRLRSGDHDGAATRFVDYWGGPDAWRRLPADKQADIAQRMPTIAAHFTALSADPSGLAAYRGLRAPVLMLAGSNTRAPIRRIGELLRFALPDATFYSLAGMGHMGPLSHASVVARQIADFVRNSAFVPDSAVPALAA